MNKGLDSNIFSELKKELDIISDPELLKELYHRSLKVLAEDPDQDYPYTFLKNILNKLKECAISFDDFATVCMNKRVLRILEQDECNHLIDEMSKRANIFQEWNLVLNACCYKPNTKEYNLILQKMFDTAIIKEDFVIVFAKDKVGTLSYLVAQRLKEFGMEYHDWDSIGLKYQLQGLSLTIAVSERQKLYPLMIF